MPEQPPTLLAVIIERGEHTHAETVKIYNDCARRLGENATICDRTLRRWMAGQVQTSPRPSQCRVAERLWGHPMSALLAPAPAEALAMSGLPERAIHAPVAVPAASGLPSKSGTGTTPAGPGYDRSRRPRGHEVGDRTDRRQVIRVMGAAAAGAAFGGLFSQAAEAAMEFTRRAEASDVGPQTLEHLDMAIADMAAAFSHTPPAEMFRAATAYRQNVARLLEGKQTLRQRRELYRHAANLSIILGWLSNDLVDPRGAHAHCLDAWEHGWQAEDGTICGQAMDTAATIAMYSHRPERAKDAAVRGLSQVLAGTPAAVRLTCQLARANGCLGQHDQFDDALASARQQFDQLPHYGSGLFAVDAGRIASYAASASIWLGRPKTAVAHARDALTFYADTRPAERSPTREAIARLDLGLALLAMNSPDDAASETLTALSSERITGSVLARAGEIETALRRSHPTLASTRQVHEQFAVLTRPN